MKKYMLFIFFFLYNFTIVTAATQYKVNDYVYFDPIKNEECNEKSYWTPYYQNTTCYRFVILNNEDTTANETIKIMLDHDIGVGTYDNYQTILKDKTQNWKGFEGSIDIIDEPTIKSMMKLSSEPSIGHDVKASAQNFFLVTNTKYYVNSKLTNNNGYWSKTVFESNNSYIYTVKDNGCNSLVQKTETRGIRPVIVMKKDKLTNDSTPTIDITHMLDSKSYFYESADTSLSGNKRYKQLQGFTVVKDKLIFYSSNADTPDKGIVFTYDGEDYTHLFKLDYTNGGHGNDFTYNSKTNKVFMVGADSNNQIFVYDADTMDKKDTINIKDNIGTGLSSIAYDYVNDYYIGGSSRRFFIITPDWQTIKYSFDMPATQTDQGKEYHNGYIYSTVFEQGTCPSSYQIYCYGDAYSAYIYVYNAKIESNGKPHKDFGHLVKKIYIGSGFGELETVSFANNKMYLGYAAQHYDINKYVFKFFTIDDDKVEIPLEYEINATGDKKNYTITISSEDELLTPTGWVLSNDKRSISKELTEEDKTTNLNLCDRFGNCQNININTSKYTTTLPEPVDDEDESNLPENDEDANENNKPNDDLAEEETDLSEEKEETILSPNTGEVIPIAFLFILLITLFIINYKAKKQKKFLS